MREENNYNYLIEMDGLFSCKIFKKIDEVGFDIYIVGWSGLFVLIDNILELWDIMINDYFEMIGKKLN